MKRIIIKVANCFQCRHHCRDDHDHSYRWCGHTKFDYGYEGDVDNGIREEDMVDGFPRFCPLGKKNK